MSNSNKTQIEIPEPSGLTTLIALCFVPGVPIVLLFSMLVTIAIGGGVIYLAYYIPAKLIGIIPTGIILLIGIGVLIGIFAVIKGLVFMIIKGTAFERAYTINISREPKLKEFIDEICKSLDVRPPDNIILHCEPTFFVMQGKLDTYKSRIKGRTLAVSMPLLSYLTKNELRAILTHEFAHFTGRDTVFSAKVLPVYRSLSASLNEMGSVIGGSQGEESDGSALWMIIPLLIPYAILNIYLVIFNIINMSISRLREKRADIIASYLCGYNSFKNGLLKTVGIGWAFNEYMDNKVLKPMDINKIPESLYPEFKQFAASEKNRIKTEIAEEYKKTESEDASHPAIKERLSYIPKTAESYKDSGNASEILSDISKYEKYVGRCFSDELKNYVNFLKQVGIKFEDLSEPQS